MNYPRLALAALGGTVAHFAYGFLVFWLLPGLIKEARKYPSVFRPKEEMMKRMPISIASIFVSILIVAIIFAMLCPAMLHPATFEPAGSATTHGALLGALIGLFAVSAVLHNYVNLNTGLKLALLQSAAYFIQWTIVGTAIALIYQPLGIR